MSKVSQRTLDANLRTKTTAEIAETVENLYGAAYVVGSNKVAVLLEDETGAKRWALLTVSVPSGSRDGEQFDGYAEAEAYAFKVEEDRKKAEAAAAKKAKKMPKIENAETIIDPI